MTAPLLARLLVSVAFVAGLPAFAHHSFAVHFVGDRVVTVQGTVTAYSFRNPHGVIELAVEGGGGAEEAWKIETNSPNILRRRGWSEASIKAGDAVTIEGYPARDGSTSMRVYRVTFADGRELIGQRPDPAVAGGDD